MKIPSGYKTITEMVQEIIAKLKDREKDHKIIINKSKGK